MRKIMLLLAVAGIVMAGCGSDKKTTTAASASSSSTSGSSSGSSAGAPVSLPGKTNTEGDGKGDATSGSISVELEDFYMNPTYIKATAGGKVKLSLKNTGGTAHTFTSSALGVDETLQPGASKDVEVTLPASGATEFHCRFHQSSGMQGAFFFNEGDTLAGGSGSGSGASSSESSSTYNN
jgi:plastocyanin